MKDVYLRLDGRKNEFETDESGTPWIDLAFDGSAHQFYHRTSVWAGAAVSLEVLEKMGQSAEILGSKLKFTAGQENEREFCGCYRYILCNEDHVVYLEPSECRSTTWTPPTGVAQWLYVDQSAVVTPELVRHIEAYLALSGQTRLAVFIDARRLLSAGERRLAELANLIFTNGDLSALKKRGLVCEIRADFIQIGELRRNFKPAKGGLLTELTNSLVAAGTVLGGLLKGLNTNSTLKMVQINVENSQLTGSLPFEQLSKSLAQQDRAQNYLRLMARTLMTEGKGILAADESDGSIARKFGQLNIENTEANRRNYRQMLFGTPDLNRYVSGVILFDETVRQRADNGMSFVDFLTAQGVMAGIKIDKGLETFRDEETLTLGLEGLEERLTEYYDLGLRFAKWRAAFRIEYSESGEMLTPSAEAIQRNASALAQYARACQAAGLVPIVEPEVLHEGHYGIDACAEATRKVWRGLFQALAAEEVDLTACILKCNMILSGSEWEAQSDAQTVGEWTARLLREEVPAELAGVVFLSGGQAPERATANLAAVCAQPDLPWPVTFSFGRALQDPAAKIWAGETANTEEAQEALRERLRANAEVLKK